MTDNERRWIHNEKTGQNTFVPRQCSVWEHIGYAIAFVVVCGMCMYLLHRLAEAA